MYRFPSIPFIAYNLSVKELIKFLMVYILLFVESCYSSICSSVLCIFCKLVMGSKGLITFPFDPFGNTIGGKYVFSSGDT